MTTSEAIPFRRGRLAPCIAVTNIERSVSIYRRLLDLEKTFENGTPVGFVILKREDAELHLSLDREHRSSANNVAHLIVSDATALHQRCERMGVSVIKGLRDQGYGLRAFVIADPDGNRIDVGQPI